MGNIHQDCLDCQYGAILPWHTGTIRLPLVPWYCNTRVLHFPLYHPRPALSVEAKPITTKTLTLLMRWQKVAQAMKMARVKYDAEVRGLPAQARATADQVRDLVGTKFPPRPPNAEAIPTQADLPKQDWKWSGRTAHQTR